jgi:hypothetical protein
MNRDNLAGFKFCDIEEISINEYHPLPNGEGKPTQVHMLIQVKGIKTPFIMRFKSPETLGKVVAALQEHSGNVWPKEFTPE